MYLPITLASVLLLTFVILLLRIFWLRVPATLRLYLIWASVIVVLINIVLAAAKLEIASDRMNVILKWLAVAGYELLLMLFTRLSPRWLTSICGLVLLVPVFAASFLMPLAPLFDPVTHALVPITANLAYQKLPWGGDDVGENSGIKLVVSRGPALLRFCAAMLNFSSSIIGSAIRLRLLPCVGRIPGPFSSSVRAGLRRAWEPKIFRSRYLNLFCNLNLILR
jgi:hypothetical protein